MSIRLLIPDNLYTHHPQHLPSNQWEGSLSALEY